MIKIVPVAGLALLVAGCSISPEPLTLEQRREIIDRDRNVFLDQQKPIDRPISVYDAMARTLANNLGYRVQLMEQSIALGQFELAKNEMLPQVTTTVEGIDRHKQSVSSSRSFETQTRSVGSSTSQDRSRIFGDLTFAWNLLDFGVSYHQARQEADRALIARELRRKSLQNLILQVRSAFW